ncbi:hypothetical protein AGMMS50239_23580 [Bacteroidia bacterium]|nr:hypothetical protein AGMMS50239_23580 [Bacteroidia bacterium]
MASMVLTNNDFPKRLGRDKKKTLPVVINRKMTSVLSTYRQSLCRNFSNDWMPIGKFFMIHNY